MKTLHTVRRLIELFAPAHYDLSLDISARKERHFAGTVTIIGKLLAEAPEITLHSRELTITTATIDGQPATTKAGEDDELSVIASSPLRPGEHTVALEFTGKITDPMHGLYPCYFTLEGEKRELLMTQLESHYAREVFPCIDEPAGKATFVLRLATEPDITVLGNTPITSQKTKGGTLVTVFEQTPVMSPYLLAFVAGPLAFRETKSRHGITIRTYATPDKADQTDFALEFAAQVLDFYEDYFGTAYPLPKCDLVAVPDFAAGAMENWGLITFRENALLVDPHNASTDTKEVVAKVTAHELAHQWFGNLVTMAWWDDMWLNESFANWMEYRAVEHIHPEWHVWDQFASYDQQYALSRDGLSGVQAVREPVHHPDELHGLFDPAIVYAKGSCLIRMLHQYVGAEAFRGGLRVYMQKHRYGNTTADDLWATLQTASHHDIISFMHSWLTQPGHPVLNVEAQGQDISLSQRRFYANPQETTKDPGSLWAIPLLSSQLETPLLIEKAARLKAKPGALLINDGYVGFYHTHYSAAQLSQLAEQVKTQQLSMTSRLGLLIDGLALARAGLGSTVDLLRLLEAYRHETTYPVWQAIFPILSSMRMIINQDQKLKPLLQRYVRQVVEPEFKRLGWEPKAEEPYFDTLLRSSIIALMTYAQVPTVIKRALQLYDAAHKPEDLPADFRSTIYTVAIRTYGRAAYEQLLKWYEETTSAEERINLTIGLTSVRSAKLAREATTLFMTKIIKPQDLAYWFAYLMRNRHGYKATWQWMETHWDWICGQFKGDHDYADFPKYAASALSTREQLEAYKRFFEPKLDETDIAMVIKQGIDDIMVRILWRERDLAAVSDFLRVNQTSRRPATTASPVAARPSAQ